MNRLFVISENSDGKIPCDVCGKLVFERSAMMRELNGKDLWLCHSCDATYDDDELKDVIGSKTNEAVDNPPISEAVDAENAKKGKLKDDLIRMGALKKDDPIYKGNLDKIIKYAKMNQTNEQRIFLARTFHHLRTSVKSPEEVKFWKEFDEKWEKLKEKEDK